MRKLAYQPDQRGDPGQRRQGGHIDARGDGQPQEEAEKRPPPFTMAVLGGAHGHVKGDGRQPGGPIVHGEEVGLLDGHDRQGVQQGGQQPGPPVVQPLADEEDEEDGE
jgi:hypothetical protein